MKPSITDEGIGIVETVFERSKFQTHKQSVERSQESSFQVARKSKVERSSNIHRSFPGKSSRYGGELDVIISIHFNCLVPEKAPQPRRRRVRTANVRTAAVISRRQMSLASNIVSRSSGVEEWKNSIGTHSNCVPPANAG